VKDVIGIASAFVATRSGVNGGWWRYLQDRGMQIYEMAKEPAGSRPHWYMQSSDFDKVQVIREQPVQEKERLHPRPNKRTEILCNRF
jgi:hypothetical protein